MREADPAIVDATYREALQHQSSITDHISVEQFAGSFDTRPPWVIGPFERDDSLTFRPEGQWDDPTGVGWTSNSIFNPSIIERGDELHLFYRASPRKESLSSRIGHAVHTPDAGWRDSAANPVVYPTFANENLSCEDPKVYAAEGRYFLFYNANWTITDELRDRFPSPDYPLGDVATDIMLAVSDDLETWEKVGLAVPYEVSRLWAKGAVIPRNGRGEAVRIGGEYLMYISEGCGGRPVVGHSDDMLNWTFTVQPYLDMSALGGTLHEVACAVVGAGAPDDLVLDFFYSDADGAFSAAQAHYTVDAPFTQKGLHRGGSLAWGGLIRQGGGGEWMFAQGWDAPVNTREMYFYRSVPVAGGRGEARA